MIIHGREKKEEEQEINPERIISLSSKLSVLLGDRCEWL